MFGSVSNFEVNISVSRQGVPVESIFIIVVISACGISLNTCFFKRGMSGSPFSMDCSVTDTQMSKT